MRLERHGSCGHIISCAVVLMGGEWRVLTADGRWLEGADAAAAVEEAIARGQVFKVYDGRDGWDPDD
jgi:hypothetical protein